MVRVSWTEAAIDDIESIRLFIAQFDPAAADATAAGLRSAGDGLDQFPRRGRLAEAGWRELSVRPYIVSYDIVGEIAEILNVRHMAQDR